MSDRRTIQVEVKLQSLGAIHPTHHEEWFETDLFCPFCGRQGMWQETGDGDYYLGAESICPSCGRAQSCLPSSTADVDPQPSSDERLAAIRTVVF